MVTVIHRLNRCNNYWANSTLGRSIITNPRFQKAQSTIAPYANRFILYYRKKPLRNSFLSVFGVYFFFFLLPHPLFDDTYSSVLYSREGDLMNAQIAEDEQWRFPLNQTIEPKIKTCITQFEDEYFRYHPGFNPFSIVKALRSNISSGAVKRGGSTITMQTVRLFRQNPKRTYFEKFYELLLAFRLECTYSKNTILALYLTHAPFGGNIVGVETASWRYFGRKTQDLSWAECATLAVLPNAPAMIYPGKNQAKLIAKRNRLLFKLFQNGKITKSDYELAVSEEAPKKLFALPHQAPHLLDYLHQKDPQSIFHTTLSTKTQLRVGEILRHHHHILKQNFINNLAAMVVDTKSGEILAYVGNTEDTVEGYQVDMIHRPRSSGSTLKPFLFASMIDRGDITPNTLFSDIPMDIGGYEPMNSNHQFDGIVMAKDALTRSLNIPWILALKQFGYASFHHILQQLGFSFFDQSAAHYGLSLVVGGGEVSMYQLLHAYRMMALQLLHLPDNQNIHATEESKENIDIEMPFSAAASYITFETLTNVVRPEDEIGWQYRINQKLAWKTGTSHGFKDAWAVGVNDQYAIVVWAGNAEGIGRPNLTGIKVAAPILFDILNALDRRTTKWFAKPNSELKTIEVCAASGLNPTKLCPSKSTTTIPAHTSFSKSCTYHKELLLDHSMTYQVNSSCYPINEMQKKVYFVLPSLQASYYKARNPFYSEPPPYMPSCTVASSADIQILFPQPNVKIYLPKVSDNHVVFKAYSASSTSTLYWYIDRELVGTTKNLHELSVDLSSGTHSLAIQNDHGTIVQRNFSVEE